MSSLTSDNFAQLIKSLRLPEKFASLMQGCYSRYLEVVQESDVPEAKELFKTYLTLIGKQIQKPYAFSLYHEKVTSPFDYEAFGKAFMKPLIIFEESKLLGKETLYKMEEALKKKENVIFLANHQTEPDPQILQLMLQEAFPLLTESLIFVAGDRVITDPMAVPFSLGCNLFCIFSKKHIEHPPEKKEEKLLHNQKSLKCLAERLSQGGAAIYIAPSGGRDRKGADGTFEVAPFDAQSLEMLALFAEEAKRPTHFYPLALKTFAILPPPSSVDVELGEERVASRSSVGIAFGEEVQMERITGDPKTKRERREERAKALLEAVKKLYEKL